MRMLHLPLSEERLLAGEISSSGDNANVFPTEIGMLTNLGKSAQSVTVSKFVTFIVLTCW